MWGLEHMLGKHWDALRKWIDWGVRRSRYEALATGAAFPIVECVFVNLLTGVPEGARWPFGLALAVLATLHGILLLLQVLPLSNYPIQCVADAVEASEKISKCQAELNRRTRVHKSLRSVIEALNLQTCQINPLDHDGFAQGIRTLMTPIISDPRSVLGIESNNFTIEVYCRPDAVQANVNCAAIAGYRQDYFFTGSSVNPCDPIRLAARSPCAWAIQRAVPGTCRPTSDPNFFMGPPASPPDCYFNIIAAVPIYLVCSKTMIGVFIVTSQQDEPFADDVLDTMQFLASLISQYIASHNRCVIEFGAAYAKTAFFSRPTATTNNP
jgi:hypothetical protein